MYTYEDIEEAQALGIISAYWMDDDYEKLLLLVIGKRFEYRAGTHFYARWIAQRYSECNIGTTPYEVSMWLRKKIEETK